MTRDSQTTDMRRRGGATGEVARPVPEGWPWAWWDPPPAERERVAVVLEWARRAEHQVMAGTCHHPGDDSATTTSVA